MMEFFRSPGYSKIVAYLENFCLLVKGRIDLPTQPYATDISNVLALLSQTESAIQSIAPIDQPMRFGNKAFRTFHSWLVEHVDALLVDMLGNSSDLISELVPYILDAFGNPVRIDYGTGHEAAFLMFLIVLIEAGRLEMTPSVVQVVFRKYINVVRLVTMKYMMEPAGSHGVWGLDDYHHLPFLFGSAQLIGHESSLVKPSEILVHCDSLAHQSMYAECIQFIKLTKCKFARFQEVAPILSDCTRNDSWSQVCFGLMKLYKSEVLSKRPIAQHFFFGKSISWSNT